MISHSAVFICSSQSLNPSGGVGICTQEYIQTLRAGFNLEIISYDTDKRLNVRIRRKLFARPYAHRVPAEVIERVVSVANRMGAEFVFLNLVDLAPIACSLKEKLGKDIKIVLLSHGLESVDYLHMIRTKDGASAFTNTNRYQRDTLARQLISECTQREFIDHVFCLAPFEVEIERWLGAKNVSWLPRMIASKPLTWSPVPARLGFVGTLDHPPNKEGLKLFADALRNLDQHAVLRVAGGPLNHAIKLSKTLPNVEYLGPLSNNELEKEASTWNCFVNPIFCYARGCSTKLAVGLSWGIPIITTPAGCRGYSWREGTMNIAETPEGLAELAVQMFNPGYQLQAQQEVLRIVASAPSLMDVVARIRKELIGFQKITEQLNCVNFN